MDKIDILSLEADGLREFLDRFGFPRYRTAQIYRALHRELVTSIAQITTLSLSDRARLDAEAEIAPMEIMRKLTSSQDGTVKYLFRLGDGQLIESVLMRYRHGSTVCLSTQAGCRMGCVFCASTIGGLKRNLTPGEMLGQVYSIVRDCGERVSNIVLMGIGEPLDNYGGVISFLRLINSPDGQNIGYRHISLSTCGIADKIERLAQEDMPITLSVSLHAPYDELRSSLMPVNRKHNIARLMEACKSYCRGNGRRISYEYALIGGVNDSEDCARRLCELLKGYEALSHINLIPINRVEERGYSPSDKRTVLTYQQILTRHGYAATVRRHLGGDINASCGQLRNDKHT